MDHVSDDSQLVSLDVSSSYTNISDKEGNKSVKQKIKKPRSSISIKLILKLILTLNNFGFNGINYLQKKGCVMGTKCVPSYANIPMGWFEERFILPLLTNLSNFHLCFIDIFLIWNGTKTEFDNFLKKNNE